MPQSPSQVVAALSYLKPTSQAPCSYAYEPPPGIPWENAEYELKQMPIADARTLVTSDLVRSEVRYPRRTGEIYQAVYSPLHRWSYYSKMDRHEALVFKQYDSQISGVARYVLHAAFDHPYTPSGAPLRESIELRCLVVYE